MIPNPLIEIRRVERSVSLAISDATSQAADAVAEARREAEQLVAEARARGLAAAERRYQEGLVGAREEAERILGDGDERVGALRRGVEMHVPAAVDSVMAVLLPDVEGGRSA